MALPIRPGQLPILRTLRTHEREDYAVKTCGSDDTRCKAEHVKSVPVIEMFWQKVAWDGVVEVFRLTGHPKAKRCYAWSFTEDKETRFVTVLEMPPVESAQTAVRAAIASESKIDDCKSGHCPHM